MSRCDAYIGLGSNLSDPIAQLNQALNAIHGLKDTCLLACSAFYRSTPMGPSDQPDYVNAVAKISTSLAPEELLSALQRIEQEQGRERKDERWGPRTLDLDILLFGQQVIDSPTLTVPHYGMREREFVLYPLAEIAPQLTLPGGEKLQTILNNCPINGLQKLPVQVPFSELVKDGKTLAIGE